MNYSINLGSWGSVFAVPKELADNELRLAGAVPLKVILYILCHSGEALDDAVLSEKLGYSTAVISDAVKYWTERGLIVDRDGLAVPETKAGAAQSPSPAPPEEKPESKKPASGTRTRMRYSYGECVDMISGDQSLSQMLSMLEAILSKQLNHSEITAFVTLVKWYGMPTECVAIIAEHCKSIGKPMAQYIESVAISLAGQEITSIEAVSGYVERTQAARRAWNRVRGLLEIPERMATPRESEITSRWVNEYLISDELIRYAYELCVNQKGKLSFPYMEGIIKKWRMKGITDLEAAKAEQEGAKKKKSADGEYKTEYNSSEIEEMLDYDWMNDD